MIAIYKKELRSYFYTTDGYVFLGMFLFISGFLFYLLNISRRSGDIPYFFGSITYLWIPLIPIITMRLFAEEKQKKTDQLIFTAPLSISDIVLGKFLAASVLLMVAAMSTIFFVIYVGIYGTLYKGETLVSYMGFILQGLSFVAIDLFISSLTKNPTTAAISSTGVNLIVWIINVLAENISNTFLAKTLRFLSIYNRYIPFSFGQLSYANIIYYIVVIAIFIIATIIHLQGRRWRKG